MPFDPAPQEITDPVLKVLIDANALLSDESKWCQHDFHPPLSDTYCVLGALGLRDSCAQEINIKGSSIYPAIKVLARCTPIHGLPDIDCVWSFNDDPTTTFADIKALFAKAIAARQEELARV